MSDKAKSPPFPTLLGGGKNRDLITVPGKRSDHLNTIVRSRLLPEEVIDIAILDDIAGTDEGHQQFIDTFLSGTMGERGLARSEHAQMSTGVMIPTGLPRGSGHEDDDPKKKPGWIDRMRKKNKRDDEEDDDA